MKDRKLTLGSLLHYGKGAEHKLNMKDLNSPNTLDQIKPLEGSVRLSIAAQAPADSAQI